jgi:cycloartenol synthase
MHEPWDLVGHCTQDVLWWALYKAENLLLGSWLRKSALSECMKHIHYEASHGHHGNAALIIMVSTTWLRLTAGLHYPASTISVPLG